ncbi:MAG: hypothetical protein ACRECX_00925 [Methyloceanibacter sp.]|uniref:hypothetical protein n=1 Tax=Methyloceanibacter sp. TaxID=1965321 RepID=UPI003D6CFE93
MRGFVSCVAAGVAALILSSTAEANLWHATSPRDGAALTAATTIGFGCKIIDRKLVCGKDIGGDKNGGGAKKQDDKDQENKKKTGNICEGEIACPPGYMVLDKPNKYGACCELVEQKATCPADRPVGTPPNCCPEGTQFNKGACYPPTCSPGWEGVPPDCTPPTPVGPTPKKSCPDGSKVDATKPCPGEQHCTTCGGPGCLQNGTPCPFGGVTTCRPIEGKTYYNCCCP